MRTKATMAKRSLLFFLGAALLLGSPAAALSQEAKSATAEKDAVLLQTYINRWVSATQDLSKTKGNWQFEKDILLATKDSLSGEVDQIKSQIEEAKKEEVTVDETSKDLSKEQVELANAAEAVTAIVETSKKGSGKRQIGTPG